MKQFMSDTFWAPEQDHRPPLTHTAITDTEHFLGVKLPESYLELLHIQNGGYTQGFKIPMDERTSWADDHVPLLDLAGIVDGGIFSILDTPQLSRAWRLPSRQILLTGDGPWWITLDYRISHKPSVAWIDPDMDEDLQIAPDFDTFLELLQPNPVEELVAV